MQIRKVRVRLRRAESAQTHEPTALARARARVRGGVHKRMREQARHGGLRSRDAG